MLLDVEFLNIASDAMYRDRPDIWSSPDDAINVLNYWAARIVSSDLNECYMGTGGWVLSRLFSEEEGVIEWQLNRQIVDYTIATNPHETDVFNWIKNSRLFE